MKLAYFSIEYKKEKENRNFLSTRLGMSRVQCSQKKKKKN